MKLESNTCKCGKISCDSVTDFDNQMMALSVLSMMHVTAIEKMCDPRRDVPRLIGSSYTAGITKECSDETFSMESRFVGISKESAKLMIGWLCKQQSLDLMLAALGCKIVHYFEMEDSCAVFKTEKSIVNVENSTK